MQRDRDSRCALSWRSRPRRARSRHQTVNAEYRFLQLRQESSTYGVNFKTGRMFSWKAIISFCCESNAVVMHGRRRRHETVGVARQTDNLFVTETTSDRRPATHHIQRRDTTRVTTSWRSWWSAQIIEGAAVPLDLLRQSATWSSTVCPADFVACRSTVITLCYC